MTISFWSENVDWILDFNDKKILQGKGTISNAMMEKKVKEIYQQFDAVRKTWAAQQADEQDLKEIEQEIKSRKNNTKAPIYLTLDLSGKQR